MTSFTASMRDATKCQESLVEKWFLLLVKTKLTFLGVKDAYFHTVYEQRNMLRPPHCLNSFEYLNRVLWPPVYVFFRVFTNLQKLSLISYGRMTYSKN